MIPPFSHPWLDTAIGQIRQDPTAIVTLFPATGRRCGRDPMPGGWRSDDVARCHLLLALAASGGTGLIDVVTGLYRFGDADEKRAILYGLADLDLGDAGLPLIRDALRTNDTRLVAAAMGRPARCLDDEAWRHGVLKCVFMGLALSVVDGLDDRADGELAAMLDALARERTAAGRNMPADALALLARLNRGEPSRAHL
jgi:hypothetical protein